MAKSLNPWNNIPKHKNSTPVHFENKNFKFSSDSLYLPRGLGRSYGDVCLNENGKLILTNKYDSLIAFNKETGYLKCESGISLNEILNLIVPQGWFLPVVPGTSYVSVGGAIANDIHGKNHHKFGTFGNSVIEIELLRSDGEVLKCSEKENYDFFKATIGGLGLTGLILSATIKLIKVQSQYISTKRQSFRSIEEYFDLNSANDNKFDYTVSWVDFPSNNNREIRGIYHSGNHESNFSSHKNSKNRNLTLSLPFYPPISLVNNLSINILNSIYFRLNKLSKNNLQHYRNFFFPLDLIKNWNKAYGKKGFYQYQFVVPLQSSELVMNQVFKILDEKNHRPALGVLKNFGSVKSVGMLSFPTEGVTLAIDLQNKGKETLSLLNRLDEILLQNNGRIYPAKDARMSKEMFLSNYKNFDHFLKFIDPRFSSTFLERVS